MNKEEIIEGNKLIAEFMGTKVKPDGYFIKDYLYHSSWDWLMPVLRKIKDYLNNMERPSKNHCCKGDMIEIDIQCRLWEVDIEKTHHHVVEFLQWYNQQNR